MYFLLDTRLLVVIVSVCFVCRCDGEINVSAFILSSFFFFLLIFLLFHISTKISTRLSSVEISAIDLKLEHSAERSQFAVQNFFEKSQHLRSQNWSLSKISARHPVHGRYRSASLQTL